MGFTAARRKVKTKTLAKSAEREGITVLACGAALYALRRHRRISLLLLLVGATTVKKTNVILGRLQHPYAWRHMYEYGRRSLDSYPDDSFHDKFRFPKNAMKQHLNFYVLEGHFPWVVEVPYQVRERGRLTVKFYKFNLDELYMIFLRYLSTPVRQYEVAIEFGRTPQEISKGVQWFHRKLARVSKRYLQNDNQPWFNINEAIKCRDALKRKGCPVNGHPLGMVDGVNKQIARPSEPVLERECFNGHKHHHGLAFAGVALPNGIALLVLGPSPGRRHDAAVAAEHNLYEKLEALGTFPGLRGVFGSDSAYPTFWPIVPSFGPALTNLQSRYNTQMSRSRISVEWLFGQVIQQFSSLDWKIRCKVLASPVSEAYLNAAFLSNLLNIRYPNNISQYFSCPPPSLETYLHVPAGSLN